ncbi:Protease inhibitor precursor [compost metagenome]
MIKRWLSASLVLVLLLMVSSTAFAHPGRTDSKGGHYCRTNCAKWGLKNGEYHYHNGGSSSVSGKSSSSDRGQSDDSSGSKSKSSSSDKKSTASSTPTYKSSDLQVYVDGSKLSFTNRPLLIEQTNVVPLRDIADAMKATLSWDQQAGQVEVIRGEHKLTLQIGSKTVYYGETADTVQVAPKVINGVTYVPLQVVARGLGAQVEYISAEQRFNITLK